MRPLPMHWPASGAGALGLCWHILGSPECMDNSGPTSGAEVYEPTVVLIRRIRAGDAAAREDLVRRFLPILRRWAHGRLPARLRDLNETDDLVQVTLVRALGHLDKFDDAGSGAFLAYLRQALLNQVRDEIRRHQRRPEHMEVDQGIVDADTPAIIDMLVGNERMQAYERALASLPRRQQGLIVMRVEFGMSYPEIAAEVGGSADAARIMVSRAIVQLSGLLGGEPPPNDVR